ncbi:hypothetical protein [Accumulibacter sp.]|nr:hypothetical protein [Accumulibacter sp.]MCM8625115.1 hypothetical protein [Accumulibacter sp.]
MPPVAVVQEDAFPSAAPGGEIMESAGVFETKRAGLAGHSTPSKAKVKT